MGAMFNLSLAYRNGTGTSADDQAYFEWTGRAARAGHARAMFNLALAYEEGVLAPNRTRCAISNGPAKRRRPDTQGRCSIWRWPMNGVKAPIRDVVRYFEWTRKAAECRITRRR